MAQEDCEVYAIGRANDIEPGRAKAFSLSRLTETGEGRPFNIVVIRTSRDGYVGYVNACPHNRIWLNINAGEFFNEDRSLLKCGRHGSQFDIQTGLCVDGPCKDSHLEPVALAVIDGDLCLCGVALVEDDGLPDVFEDYEDTLEIMIHPE
jgi:nitrite reductase/ring-hydroxylating ferredoxin subunit